MKFTFKAAAENTLEIAFCVIVPVLLMGGIYWFPVVTYTRDPWRILLLAAGLAVTVLGIGLGIGVPLRYFVFGWLLSVLLLVLVHRAFGALGASIERFGCVHGTAIIIAFLSRTIAR